MRAEQSQLTALSLFLKILLPTQDIYFNSPNSQFTLFLLFKFSSRYKFTSRIWLQKCLKLGANFYLWSNLVSAYKPQLSSIITSLQEYCRHIIRKRKIFLRQLKFSAFIVIFSFQCYSSKRKWLLKMTYQLLNSKIVPRFTTIYFIVTGTKKLFKTRYLL